MSDHLSDIVFQEVIAERDEALLDLTVWKGVYDRSVKDRLALIARVTELEAALRYMAEYQMTGSEMTLHIDFQGKARAALAAPTKEDARVCMVCGKPADVSVCDRCCA